jgi:hypothetical protein
MLCTTTVSPLRAKASSASSCGRLTSLPDALSVRGPRHFGAESDDKQDIEMPRQNVLSLRQLADLVEYPVICGFCGDG